MKKILNIVSSVNGKNSFSTQLTNVILEKLAAEYPGSKVHTHDLAKNPFPHFGEVHFGAVYTPEAARSAEQKEA